MLLMMPGQPGSPEGVYNQFEFDKAATLAIAEGHTTPFIAVFAPIMTHPPRDTECVDVPNGPRSETWLAQDVREAISQAFRTNDEPQQWFLTGYSTGGFCATNLLLRHRDRFGTAAAVGGYYHPWVDAQSPDLFGGDESLRQANSPIWQFEHAEPRPTRLLVVTSTRDQMSWDGPASSDGDSKRMIEAGKRWPGTATMVIDRGGHGYRTYVQEFPQVLRWLGANGL